MPTEQQLLERVQQMTDLELDQKLSTAAWNLGIEHAVRGQPKGLYWIERFQDSYEIGYRQGQNRQKRGDNNGLDD